MAEKNNEKMIKFPRKSKELAELVGIILGDGCITSYKHPSKKNCYYGVRITGHAINDLKYHKNYIKKLFLDLFGINVSLYKSKNSLTMRTNAQSIKLVKFFISIGLLAGNKKANNQGIPDWIFSKKEYMSACLRGLIDTDGSVYMCGNRSKFPRVTFCSKIDKLKEDFQRLTYKLGYNTTPWNGKNSMFYRKGDIFKYREKVGFSNPYHLRRFESMLL